jgi:hypothetical protein
MAQEEQNLKHELDKFSLDQLKSFVEVADCIFLPKTRKWYVKKICSMKDSSALEKLKKGDLKIYYTPVESSVTAQDLEKVYEKLGWMLPMGKLNHSQKKKEMFQVIFGKKDPPQGPNVQDLKDLLISRGIPIPPAAKTRDLYLLAVLQHPDDVKKFTATLSDLTRLITLRGYPLHSKICLPEVLKIFFSEHYPKLIVRRKCVKIYEEEVEELLRKNFLKVPIVKSDRIKLLNNFLSLFCDSKYQVASGGTKLITFPVCTIPDYPHFYTNRELNSFSGISQVCVAYLHPNQLEKFQIDFWALDDIFFLLEGKCYVNNLKNLLTIFAVQAALQPTPSVSLRQTGGQARSGGPEARLLYSEESRSTLKAGEGYELVLSQNDEKKINLTDHLQSLFQICKFKSKFSREARLLTVIIAKLQASLKLKTLLTLKIIPKEEVISLLELNADPKGITEEIRLDFQEKREEIILTIEECSNLELKLVRSVVDFLIQDLT